MVRSPRAPIDNPIVWLAKWCIYTNFNEAYVDWDRTILKLLGAFVVLLTAFAVLQGAASIATTMGDVLGGQILSRVAIGSLLLLLINAILLLMVVAVRSIDKPQK